MNEEEKIANLWFSAASANLYQVPGQSFRFEAHKYEFGPDDVKQDIMEDDKRIVVPVLPASTIVPIAPISNDVGTWPEKLQLPLIKGIGGSEVVNGYKSGARSSLVSFDGEWYRLKGSGNHQDGFTIRTNQSPEGSWTDVRGCAFMNTAFTELYYTEKITTQLQSQGIMSCNESLGFYTYDAPNCPLVHEKVITLKSYCYERDKFKIASSQFNPLLR